MFGAGYALSYYSECSHSFNPHRGQHQTKELFSKGGKDGFWIFIFYPP